MKPREPFAPSRRTGWFVGRSDIGDYMHRWICETPFGAVRLHHILRSDEARALHDHPWTFCSLLISGGYWEVTDAGRTWWPRFSVRRVRAETPHRLILDSPVWTLVVTGPKAREWGFHTDSGWMHWREARALWAGWANEEQEP